MSRLFIGIELSPQAKYLLSKISSELRTKTNGVRWVPQDNIHLTLKFLGETPENKTASIEAAILQATERFRKFSVTLDGLGSFPNSNKARVIWIGIRYGNSELTALASAIDASMITAGFEPESKPFKPHITLARIKTPQPVGEILSGADVSGITGYVLNIGAITLFKSTLSTASVKYEPIASITLSP